MGELPGLVLAALDARPASLAEAFHAVAASGGGPVTVTAVDRALPLALRIAPLARALTWGRLFPCYLSHPHPSGNAARALAAVLRPDPLGPRD